MTQRMTEEKIRKISREALKIYGDDSEKVTVYKMSHPTGCGKQWCLVDTPECIADEIREMEIGDDILVEKVQMTKNEISLLPEFEGW